MWGAVPGSSSWIASPLFSLPPVQPPPSSATPPLASHIPPLLHSQELVAVVGRSAGLVLMSPPSGSAEARVALAALTSAIKPGTKVWGS